MKRELIELRTWTVLFGCLMLEVSVCAGQRTSTSYSITADSIAAGGVRNTSTNYTNDGSVGGVAGISIVAVPSQTLKAGYIGQIYELTAVQVAAAPATLNEGGTRQLTASATLDDGTTQSALAAFVAWNVDSGPVSGINSGGLVTAQAVYQNTAAIVRGSYFGQSGTVNLTVQDTITDNFGGYAGDGLPDGWQVQFLGINGTSGGPTLDPDFDGIPNLLEYAMNLNPALSSTLAATTVKNGSVLEYTYTRSKAAATGGTLFLVEWSDTLGAASWSGSGVAEEVLSDNGTVQQVKATLPVGTMSRRFLRLRVQ